MEPNIASFACRQSLVPLHAHKERFSLCSAHRNDSLSLLIPSSGPVVRSCDRQARVKDKKRCFGGQLSSDQVCVVEAGVSKAEGSPPQRVRTLWPRICVCKNGEPRVLQASRDISICICAEKHGACCTGEVRSALLLPFVLPHCPVMPLDALHSSASHAHSFVIGHPSR